MKHLIKNQESTKINKKKYVLLSEGALSLPITTQPVHEQLITPEPVEQSSIIAHTTNNSIKITMPRKVKQLSSDCARENVNDKKKVTVRFKDTSST